MRVTRCGEPALDNRVCDITDQFLVDPAVKSVPVGMRVSVGVISRVQAFAHGEKARLTKTTIPSGELEDEIRRMEYTYAMVWEMNQMCENGVRICPKKCA